MELTHKISIVGCGPGAKNTLTLEAIHEIAQAEVLIGTERLLALFADSTAQQIQVAGYRQECYDAIAAHADKRIAVLVTGDTGLASLAAPILARYGIAQCRVIPGISSVQVAFARVGASWEGARILSAHAAAPQLSADQLLQAHAIAVLTGGRDSAPWLHNLATALGSNWRIVICRDLTLETESITESNAASIARDAENIRAVVLFLRKDAQ